MNKTLRNLALVALLAAPFAAYAGVAGTGTADDPYQIGTPEDLQECWKLTKAGETVYFVQTADIDMAGMTEWHAFVGWDYATYSSQVNYDGKNHVIKNFASTSGSYDGATYNGYCGSVFGVLNGVVKNLGIIDVNIVSGMGAGVLGGYAGHSTGSEVTIENVYVTGRIETSYYGGGMFGTMGNNLTVRNSFANVEVVGTSANRQIGGIVGRTDKAATLENVYVAGTVANPGSTVIGLVCGGGSGSLTCDGVVAFNTGSDVVSCVKGDESVILANTDDTKQAGINEVKAWPAFSATEEINGFPALEYVMNGSGTQADPYVIASAKDLCSAYKVVDCVNGGNFYFIQTADIDMEDVMDYHAIAGYNGSYNAIIHYDGQNHVIRNFGICGMDPVDTDRYYSSTIFGVPSGEIKNLGVDGAYSYTTYQGNGILGAYAGHSNGSALTIENVFVTGTAEFEGSGNYNGGMFGTTGNEVTMTNCFANVTVKAPTGTYNAGLIGRLRNTLNLECVYVAGSVSGGTAALVASTDNKTPSVSAYQVIAFNSSYDPNVTLAALASTIVVTEENITVATDETREVLIKDVRAWQGGQFSETVNYNGYPMLLAFEDYVTGAGIFDTTVEEVEANGPAVYYNLQGVQVANPENGIYIVRRGNKVTKELVK